MQEVVGVRKYRLSAIAGCRRLWAQLTPEGRGTVEQAERFVEGCPTQDDWANVWTPFVSEAVHATVIARSLARNDPGGNQAWSLARCVNTASAVDATPLEQRRLLWDIFGNPFRPVSVEPSWLTSTVLAIARQMYESRDFSAMPILADALQDAGCESEDILSHCRQPGEHVRGCWVVDLVLGKE